MKWYDIILYLGVAVTLFLLIDFTIIKYLSEKKSKKESSKSKT